jgi:CDP-glucose 4,6-dehydratase
LSFVLANAGAEVTGLSLAPEPGALVDRGGLLALVRSIEGDITIPTTIQNVVDECAPEHVFHLAAQALVINSYNDPVQTFSTNVMGTVNVLESIRHQSSVRTCVVITSDKCYETIDRPQVETDPLGGNDPYSASKAAAELVTKAYRNSFFEQKSLAVATARAGNIVGGGDWAEHRIVPDCIRALRDGVPVKLRQPSAIRPWQHVLDAVAGYLRLGDALSRAGDSYAQAWNFGPSSGTAVSVGDFVNTLLAYWRFKGGFVLEPVVGDFMVSERPMLTLESAKSRSELGWRPLLDIDAMIEWTVDWYYEALHSLDFDARAVTASQVEQFLRLDSGF